VAIVLTFGEEPSGHPKPRGDEGNGRWPGEAPKTCEKGVPKHGSFRNHIKNLGMLLYFSEESKESK